jgi:dihydrofolate synthase/folylpolyglutamate synthase
LDGGHNPAAGKVLADTIKAMDVRPLYIIAGLINTKKPAGFLAPLKEYSSGLIAVEIAGEEASLSAKELADIAHELGFKAEPADSISAALKMIGEEASEGARILICGSLYLAGIILTDNN